MNNLTIAGNVVRDAELRNTQNGKQVLGFSVAVNRNKDHAEFFDCSVWGERAAKLQPYIRKGDRITVCGEVSAREHNGKAYLQVFVKDLTFGGSSGRSEEPRQQDQSSQQVPAGGYGDMDDEIPFMREWRG